MAQTWVKVATESQDYAATLPAGTTYRFGSGTSWSASTTVKTSTTFSPVYYTSFPFPDPASGQTKELDVLETAAAQTVVMAGVNVIVPALPIPVTTVATLSYAITVKSDGSTTGTCTVGPAK